MKLSVVICAYNEEKFISHLLRKVSHPKLPPEITDYEVIVVASGCTDETVPIVRNLMKKSRRIKLIEEEERRGKASALNKGLKVSSGDCIAIVSADVLPADDGLYNLIVPFRDSETVAVSGRPVQNPLFQSGGLSGYLARVTYRIWGRLMKRLNDAGLAAHCSGEFMALRANVLKRIPESCVADDAYIAVVARRKGVIRYKPNAIGYNVMPSNLRDYVNQRRRWLYGHFQTRKLAGTYPTVMDTLVFLKPTFVLKVLAEEIRENPSEVHLLFAATLVEAIIYVLTMFDRLQNPQYAIWPVIKSTKMPLERQGG